MLQVFELRLDERVFIGVTKKQYKSYKSHTTYRTYIFTKVITHRVTGEGHQTGLGGDYDG